MLIFYTNLKNITRESVLLVYFLNINIDSKLWFIGTSAKNLAICNLTGNERSFLCSLNGSSCLVKYCDAFLIKNF